MDGLELHTPEGGTVGVPGMAPVETRNDASGPSEIAQGAPDRVVVPGSLEERVARRRQILNERRTKQFEVPGFEDIFKVELRPLSGNEQGKIAEKHASVLDPIQQRNRVAADTLVKATVGFHGIIDEDGTTEPDESASWKSLWIGYNRISLGVEMSDMQRAAVTDRAALMSLVGTDRLPMLFGQFSQWAMSGDAAREAQNELARD